MPYKTTFLIKIALLYIVMLFLLESRNKHIWDTKFLMGINSFEILKTIFSKKFYIENNYLYKKFGFIFKI